MDPALTNRYPQRHDAIEEWIIPTRSCNATTGAQTSPQRYLNASRSQPQRANLTMRAVEIPYTAMPAPTSAKIIHGGECK